MAKGNPTVYLSRRNLLTLLSKLDRKAEGQETACTIIKRDKDHPVYPQTMANISVVAVEDEEYYAHRLCGDVHPADEERIATKTYLPKQMSESEILDRIKDLEKNKGALMKYLKDNFAGQYDGKTASKVVDEYIRSSNPYMVPPEEAEKILKKTGIIDDTGNLDEIFRS